MTSSVKVTACCSSNKEVQVTGNGIIPTTLQDGQTVEYYVYDNRSVNVTEVVKVVEAPPAATVQLSVDVGGDDWHK